MKKQSLGTHVVAKLCQVTPPTIIRWMEEGKLAFFTTLGGHRRVRDTDLTKFLKERNMPIPEELKYLEGANQMLIVDDEEQVRGVIKRTLLKLYPEAEIHEAGDGFEAGNQIAQLTPALVILDIRLPGMDGYKVCRMIRSNQRLKNTKILTISGQSPEESREQSLKAGADDFLAKPFGAEELKAKIERITRSSL